MHRNVCILRVEKPSREVERTYSQIVKFAEYRGYN